MYRVLISDLDGTLLDDNKNISKENLDAIEHIIKKGFIFMIASGRSNMSLDIFNKDIGLNKAGMYCIAYNGGMIFNAESGEKKIEHFLEKDEAVSILDITRKYNSEFVNTMLYTEGELYIENFNEDTDRYCKRSFLEPKVVKDLRSLKNKNINKIFSLGRRDILEEIEKECNCTNIKYKCSAFYSGDMIYEFNPLNIDKGSAILEFSEITGIDIKDIIAVGDNYNDISMIEKAGLGIAVSNSPEEVKKHADVVTINNNNNSVIAEIVEKYF